MNWDKTSLMNHMDNCLIAITDGNPLRLADLDQLPPWRAVLMARVAHRAGIPVDGCEVDQLADIAFRIGTAARPGWASAHLAAQPFTEETDGTR